MAKNNKKGQDPFYYLIDAFQKTGDYVLAEAFRRAQRDTWMQREQEKEEIVNQCVNEVLARITVDANVGKAILNIRELDKEIKGLARKM